MDVLAELLRRTPSLKGKGRIVSHWLRTRSGQRSRILPGGLEIALDMSVPYEAMIWIGWEEQEELRALRQLLHSGETFIDCGANIGLWSLVAAPIVWPDGRVIAFEPNPLVAKRLADAAVQSSVIEVHTIALSDKPGVLPLAAGREHNLAHISSEGACTVPATTLDAILDRRPDGIKIDVEGYELHVLNGAEQALSHRPWIIVEFNKQHSAAVRLADWSVHGHLTDLGYRAHTVIGERLADEWTPRYGYASVLYRV
ncbi:MAG: FkbM family methyltransferase [Actinobacteria bacterium]|nr:MAG: FkbM family methyltransferase [Actinomycetota bacterium]